MNDERLRRAYQAGAMRDPIGRDGCPDPDKLRALVAGEGTELARVALLDHVLSCRACREEYDVLSALAQSAQSRRRRWPIALAAMLVLVAGAGLLLRRSAPEEIRGGLRTVTLLSPAGRVDAATQLRLVWRGVPEAFAYRAEVLAGDGTPLFSATTTDTTLVVPDTIRRMPGAPYHWFVAAMLPDGTEARSGLWEFRTGR